MKVNIPTLLLDKDRFARNVEKMLQKSHKNELLFRPHLKTPQSNGVGKWLQDRGITKIAVSSLRMAAYYAKGGWKDITVAFPLNILEMELVNELAAKIQLNLLVESVESVEHLKPTLQNTVGLFIKVDAGYGRTGIAATDFKKIERVLEAIETNDKLVFKGFLTHAGHTYKASGLSAIKQIHQQHTLAMQSLRSHFQARFPDLIISYGDTPSCSVLEDFSAFDELRPGNFVFYDLAQYHIGSCELEDIAVAMLCPIVALHPERSEIVVYGGGVHFSKDRTKMKNGTEYYGRVVDWDGEKWTVTADLSYMRSLSQEHGIVKAGPRLMQQMKVGDLLAILPIHSCMAVDLMPYYLTTKGEQIEIWDKK